MLYRTLLEAQSRKPPQGWIERVILKCEVRGVVYYRTYDFDSTRHKCKRCRKAIYGVHGRLNSTGHICEVCGNPYAGFVRQSRTKRTGKWETLRYCYGDTGRLH